MVGIQINARIRCKVIALIGLFALGACNKAAKDAVRQQLNDPESAQFERVEKINGITCGLVNAKNSMGGYAGFRGFIFENDVAYIEDVGHADDEFGKKFYKNCSLDLRSYLLEMRMDRQASDLNRKSGE